jgi:hypothetical protein
VTAVANSATIAAVHGAATSARGRERGATTGRAGLAMTDRVVRGRTGRHVTMGAEGSAVARPGPAMMAAAVIDPSAIVAVMTGAVMTGAVVGGAVMIGAVMIASVAATVTTAVMTAQPLVTVGSGTAPRPGTIAIDRSATPVSPVTIVSPGTVAPRDFVRAGRIVSPLGVPLPGTTGAPVPSGPTGDPNVRTGSAVI